MLELQNGNRHLNIRSLTNEKAGNHTTSTNKRGTMEKKIKIIRNDTKTSAWNEKSLNKMPDSRE
jgi:hypothetical protein